MNTFLDKLLNGEKVKWKTLGEVAELKRGKRVTKSELNKDNKYPVYSGGISPMGFFCKKNQDANTITIVKYGSAGFVNFITEDFWANDVCYCIKPNTILNNKYVYYYLKNNENNLKSLATDAIPSHLPTDILHNLPIPIPPLPVQEEIVRILDKYTQLEAELKLALEAELEAREKQYEYYRNQLLIFTPPPPIANR